MVYVIPMGTLPVPISKIPFSKDSNPRGTDMKKLFPIL